MPKTKPQCEQIKDKRRKDLIKTATRIFAFENYKSVTIDDITSELNWSHGLFYHYYKNKEQLFIDVMNEAIDLARKLIDFKSHKQLSPLEEIRAIFGDIFTLISGTDDYVVSAFHLLFNLRLQTNQVPECGDCRQKCQLASNKIISLIKEGQICGEILQGEPEEYAFSLVALTKGLLYNRLMAGAKHFRCPSIDTVMNLLEAKR